MRYALTLLLALLILARYSSILIADDAAPEVALVRVPHGGLQPQVAVDAEGTLHMVYFKGEPSAGDVFYCTSKSSSGDFGDAIRVNSQPNSAVATGTIRGAHLAIGKAGRVHVAWNGSGTATPKGIANPDLPTESPYRLSAPMLYSRLDPVRGQFEAQRNMMTHTFALDGGGTVAADSQGNVYVIWHANSLESQVHGELGRSVWVATSHDSGDTFQPETRANRLDTGACGCCGLNAYANMAGKLFVTYRTAEQLVNRDMHLLVSQDHAESFSRSVLDPWSVSQCVMSSAALAEVGQRTYAAWETRNQIKLGRLDDLRGRERPQIFGPAAGTPPQKHPALASNSQGQIILVWTEGTGWQKGGAVAWQVFDQAGFPLANASGRAEGLPAWSFAGVFASGDNGFTLVY